jgi:DNA-binding GntR family transcriptional regulator
VATSTDIANRIVASILAQRLSPGTRLGEAQLAAISDVSRTVIREALTRLSERGVVTVNARRGWYVIEPSLEEAHDAFAARRVIELGLIRHVTGVDGNTIRKLKAHLARERQALRAEDVGARSYLLGDFHVCLAECIGNPLLSDTLRDLTARTTLISMLYQSSHDADQSCDEHVRSSCPRTSATSNRDCSAPLRRTLCRICATRSRRSPRSPRRTPFRGLPHALRWPPRHAPPARRAGPLVARVD